MTHLPYIVASYTLGIGTPIGFGLSAWLRLRAAARRLAALDSRRRPPS